MINDLVDTVVGVVYNGARWIRTRFSCKSARMHSKNLGVRVYLLNKSNFSAAKYGVVHSSHLQLADMGSQLLSR